VRDAAGRPVLVIPQATSGASIDVSRLAPGGYIVTFRGTATNAAVRFVKL